MTKKKKAVCTLHKWSNIYHLGGQDDFHCAPKLNKKFSRLLDKQVSSSHYLAMTFDETTKLETCIRGQLESQSFSLWAIAAIFASLKYSDAIPQDDSFGNMVNSLTLSLQSQAKVSFCVACFLQQKPRETFVSHLPASTHASVKHALLATPSPSLFADLVIKESFTQVKEDTNLAVVKNLFFCKGR